MASEHQSANKQPEKPSAPANASGTTTVRPPADLAQDIYHFLEDKKATDIVLLDLEEVNPYFSIFLIATANSQVQLKSLVRDVHKNFGDELPQKIGGMRQDDVASGWVIIDFIDVVVHLFTGEQRAFYNLERLWGDSRILERSD